MEAIANPWAFTEVFHGVVHKELARGGEVLKGLMFCGNLITAGFVDELDGALAQGGCCHKGAPSKEPEHKEDAEHLILPLSLDAIGAHKDKGDEADARKVGAHGCS